MTEMVSFVRESWEEFLDEPDSPIAIRNDSLEETEYLEEPAEGKDPIIESVKSVVYLSDRQIYLREYHPKVSEDKFLLKWEKKCKQKVKQIIKNPKKKSKCKVKKKSPEESLSEYAQQKRYTTEFSYETLAKAVEIEYEAEQKPLRKYGLRNVEIYRLSTDLAFHIPEDKEIPLLYEDLSLIICRNKNAKPIFAKIKYFNIFTRTVIFPSGNGVSLSTVYSIGYRTSRYLTDGYLKAITAIATMNLEKYFLTFDDDSVKKGQKLKINPPTKWFNSKIGENEQQKNIVANILKGTAYPNPFVITGGPGTGKTSVIVETILQILDEKSYAHILVTCQSNAACDEITIRLFRHLPMGDSLKVFRYFTPNMFKRYTPNKDCYFETLRENSTFPNQTGMSTDRKFKLPPLRDLLNFKVVISTMASALQLIDCFQSDHFDFIFVDECCAATEPECLVPIMGLGMGLRKVNANIVLFGDDQLLGPVLNDSLAKGLGLEQSLLERMLRLENYGPKSDRIVRLTTNYRLHPEILKYSNETFYNSSMVSDVSIKIHNFAMNWIQLPSPGIPIIFDHVEAAAKLDGISPYNLEEVEKVFAFVKNLIEIGFGAGRRVRQEQIGVATPYLSQVKQLRERLEVKYPRIDIGTTEFFQGREKPVMIISAVRTSNLSNEVHFLDNPRRLNVLLTRAKSLMIIVGNMEKLKNFSSWQPFIEHCVKNGVARKGEIDVEGGSMERIKFISTKDEISDEDSDKN